MCLNKLVRVAWMLAFFIISSDVLADSVQGRIVDGNSKTALPYAVVVIDDNHGKQHTVVADANGHFSIDNLSSGEYTFSAQYIGNVTATFYDVNTGREWTTQLELNGSNTVTTTMQRGMYRISATAGFDYCYREKVLSDLNRLPLNELRVNTIHGELGYEDGRYSVTAEFPHTFHCRLLQAWREHLAPRHGLHSLPERQQGCHHLVRLAALSLPVQQ
mgnify:CR=1 FL=1